MGNSMTSLFEFGEDALANLYDIALVTLPEIMSGMEGTNLHSCGRIQNLTIPGVNLGSYDVHYKTRKISVPTGKNEISNEFTFQLRVDRNFYFYSLLKTWVDYANDSRQYMYLGKYDRILGTMIVKRAKNDLSLAEDSDPNAGWIFHKVWIKSMSDTELDWANGDPILCDITGVVGWIENINSSILNADAKAASAPSATGNGNEPPKEISPAKDTTTGRSPSNQLQGMR